MMKLRNLYIRWKVWRDKALDIWSKSPYPANVLSNLCSNGFRFDGVLCGSMEGFLQSLKYQDTGKQRQICSMKGKNAKNMTSTHWQTDQIVWWKGSSINRQSKEFQNLIRRAYQAMFEQNERFRIALMSTRGIKWMVFWSILNLHWRSKTNRRSKSMKADMMRYRGCLGRCCQCTEQ